MSDVRPCCDCAARLEALTKAIQAYHAEIVKAEDSEKYDECRYDAMMAVCRMECLMEANGIEIQTKTPPPTEANDGAGGR